MNIEMKVRSGQVYLGYFRVIGKMSSWQYDLAQFSLESKPSLTIYGLQYKTLGIRNLQNVNSIFRK
jgi:hypothetical protein